MVDISTESKVLLAIVQSMSRATPEDVEEKAKKFSQTEALQYNGPEPDFTDKETFGSAWNELILKDTIIQRGSTDKNHPIFESNTSHRPLDELCETDALSEKQSFWSSIGEM